jgi:archaellum component FlaC
VTFSQTGQAEFDTAKFGAVSESGLNDVFRFFENETGLGSLGERFNNFTDEINGLAKVSIDQYEKTNQRLNDRIAEMSDRINVLRNSYLQKLQFADSLLGRLENQQNIVDASIQSLNLVLFGKKEE